MSDTTTTLQQAVMEALADNPIVHADEIAVHVLDTAGDIVLRGTVGSPIQRAEAVRVAAEVPGVRHVRDGLDVRVMGIDGRTDADTQAAVIDALIADPEVHADDVEVDVDDGAVTLRGLVEVPSQRERAERIAMAVPGVASVESQLRVWLTVSADDVAERVTDAITISVENNDVTLTGRVGSAEHRDAALQAAAGAPGVAAVRDALTISDARMC